MESLATRVIVEYQQVGGQYTGTISGPPFPSLPSGTVCVPLSNLHRQCEEACPRNFGDVAEASLQHISPAKSALSWYVRSRLFTSCASNVYRFWGSIIPRLAQQHNITSLPASTSGALQHDVQLEDLEPWEIQFEPRQKHALHLTHWSGDSRMQTIESCIDGDFASHTVLKCKTTGILLDLTLGQYTGRPRPVICANEQDYLAHHLPAAKVLKVFPHSPERSRDSLKLLARIDREVAESEKGDDAPDNEHGRFADRVLRKWTAVADVDDDYCYQCLGRASRSASSSARRLKRCGKCKKAVYCSKYCQVLHWKEGHKEECCN